MTNQSRTDFLNIEVLGTAVTGKIKVKDPAMKRAFGLDEAHCLDDSTKKRGSGAMPCFNRAEP